MNKTTNVNDPCPVLRATSPPNFLWSFLSLRRTKNVAAKLSRSLHLLLGRDKYTVNCSSTCHNTAHSHPIETFRLEVFMGHHNKKLCKDAFLLCLTEKRSCHRRLSTFEELQRVSVRRALGSLALRSASHGRVLSITPRLVLCQLFAIPSGSLERCSKICSRDALDK